MPLKHLVDVNGVTRVVDSPDIASDHRLIRGVSPQHLSPNGKGGQKLSSMLYNAASGLDSGMSTDSEPLVIEAGLDPLEHVQSRSEWIGAVVLTAGELRARGLVVGYDPEAGNPFHCQGWGDPTKGQKRSLAKTATWLVQIPNTDLHD